MSIQLLEEFSMNLKKIFPILFFVTSLNVSLATHASESGNGGSKVWSRLQQARCAVQVQLPDSHHIRCFYGESSDEFSLRNFAIELAAAINGFAKDKELDMAAVRCLVAEWEKGEAVDIAELVEKLKNRLYTPIKESLRGKLTALAQTRKSLL